MLELYYTNIYRYNYQKDLDILPSNRRKYSLMFKDEHRIKQSVGAYVLLKKALENHQLKIIDYPWVIEHDGKPSLKGCPIEFNYSHSGNYLVVAISSSPVGVDVQKKNQIKNQVFSRVLSSAEKKHFGDEKSKDSLFYKVWSRKEAYLKFLGHPGDANLQDIPSFGVEGITFMDFNFIKGYSLALVTPLLDEIKITKVDL